MDTRAPTPQQLMALADDLCAAFARGEARAHLEGLPPRLAALSVRTLLLRPNPNLDALREALPPAQYPLVSDPEAPFSLVEEAVLLGLPTPEPGPLLDGAERLGWTPGADGQLVPTFARRLARGHARSPRAGPPGHADPAPTPEGWLCSPERLLPLSPELLVLGPLGQHAVRTPEREHALPLDAALTPVREGLRAGGARAAAGLERLHELLDLGTLGPDPTERLHLLVLAHAGPDARRASLLTRAARESLHYGTDADQWAWRLELLLPPDTRPAWALHRGQIRPRLLHRMLADLLWELGPAWPLSAVAEDWLQSQARVAWAPDDPARALWERERLGDPADPTPAGPSVHPVGVAARRALARHRRPWFTRLPPAARQECLELLGHTPLPLPVLDWVLGGLQEGVGEEEQRQLAQAWRARVDQAGSPELLARLGALALPQLGPAERRACLAQAAAAAPTWRVAATVVVLQAAARLGDAEAVEAAATQLERELGGGVLAVPAAIGLLQQVRLGLLTPKAAWTRRVRARLGDGVANDPRVLRELDLVG